LFAHWMFLDDNTAEFAAAAITEVPIIYLCYALSPYLSLYMLQGSS
jgi:hypothetical protein